MTPKILTILYIFVAGGVMTFFIALPLLPFVVRLRPRPDDA